MAELVVKSATPADGTFSATGTTVWNAGMAPSSGQLSAGFGGTGVDGSAAANGRLLIGNGAGYTLANLTQGGGVTITNGAGSITIASSGADSTLLFAGAPNSDFDLTNGGAGGAVTVLSKSITGIVAGDQVLLDVWYTILNNSTANRNYTPLVSLGSFSTSAQEAGSIASNATNRANRRIGFQISVSASNLAYGLMNENGSSAGAANAAGALTASLSNQTWNSTTSDLTGSQTLVFSVASTSTTTTQTLTLHSYTIRKISTI